MGNDMGIRLRLQKGHDHSYYTIATFAGEFVG